MHEVFNVFAELRKIKPIQDDDLPDRINRQFSSILFLILASVVGVRQWCGDAIHCWCPEQCASNHELYSNLMCWVDDTYYVPFFDKMPQQDEGRDRKITYYQWVPIILVLQATMFVAPRVVWKFFSGRSGINVGSIVDAASASQTSQKQEDRDIARRYAVFLMDRYLISRDVRRTGCCSKLQQWWADACLSISGSCICVGYLTVKLLYVTNAIGQLFLLDKFLGYEFHAFGYLLIRHLWTGEEWVPSERFPRVTLCDYRIRQNTNVQMYTVQCVLPINLFNEKIFAIVWFWLILVGFITICSFFLWCFHLLIFPARLEYVQSLLRAMNYDLGDRLERTSLMIFTKRYLRRDGIFVLNLVGKNVSELVAAEILHGLWLNYGSNHRAMDVEKDLSRHATINIRGHGRSGSREPSHTPLMNREYGLLNRPCGSRQNGHSFNNVPCEEV